MNEKAGSIHTQDSQQLFPIPFKIYDLKVENTGFCLVILRIKSCSVLPFCLLKLREFLLGLLG